MAHSNGSGGYFDLNGDRTKYERLIQKAGAETLSNLEKLIVQLVQTRDADALSKLQTCCGELFKRASECLENGKDIKIEED